MTAKRYVIIGNGPAGLNAADALRTRDSESTIVLIGQEPALPYSPTILPYLVSGMIKEKDLFLWKEDRFKSRGITLIRGNGAHSVSPPEEKVYLRDGSSLPYEVLILAPGGSPLLPHLPGLKGQKPLVLRTLADARRLRSKALKTSRAVILGAGLIGMQSAQSLAEMGIEVRVIEVMGQVLPGYFDRKAAGIIQRGYESRGVTFSTSARVDEVGFRKGNFHLRLKGEKSLEAPLLLVATGVSPAVDFLKGTGIALDQGVLIDREMRTNIPNIFAAGDAVQLEGFRGEQGVRQPILTHAVDQGRMAARSALGEKVSYPGYLSVNLFHFFGNLGLSIGLTSPNGNDPYETHQSFRASKRQYRKFVFDRDILIGVMTVNAGIDPGIFLQLIRRRIPLAGYKKEFLKNPLEMGRKLMCLHWR